MRAARACLCAAALAALAALAPPALAAGSSAADRDAARVLAGKGYEVFEAGQYQRAIDLFRQAEARYHAPPHWLYIARAQLKLGKLLEAESSFQHLVDEKLAADAPAPFKEAQASARSELTEVTVLIPSITITLEGDPPSGTRVLLDGVPVDPKSVGQPLRQNPGSHTVRAEPPGQPALERTVLLKTGGEEAHVQLPFPRVASRSVVPAVIAFSVGAVGIGVGTTAAILSIHAAPAKVTPLRVTEIVGFASGGIGIGAGILLLALRPKAPAAGVAAAPLRVRARVGLGSLTLAGEF